MSGPYLSMCRQPKCSRSGAAGQRRWRCEVLCYWTGYRAGLGIVLDTDFPLSQSDLDESYFFNIFLAFENTHVAILACKLFGGASHKRIRRNHRATRQVLLV